MRTELKQGEIITLETNEYVITRVLGEGATCIVYDAKSKDGYCRIKECYPDKANIKRVNQTLAWESDEEQSEELKKFKTTHEKFVKLQNEPSIGNAMPYPVKLISENDTLYSVMGTTHGATFDELTVTDLDEILNITLKLTNIIGELHANGFLHCDIKPQNIFVGREPNLYVYIFDVDTIVPITALKSMKSFLCSKEWAAPEYFQADSEEICEASDIYSIGAVLFEKITGNIPTSIDRTNFADWDLDNNPLFENVNLKIKRLVKNIFKKTLAASPDDRYQSADELAEAIKETMYTYRNKAYIVSSCPVCTYNFVGRTDELEKLENALVQDGNKKIAILHGLGGIGKSTIVQEFIKRNRYNYDSISFIKYNGSMDNYYSSIKIKGCDDVDNKDFVTKNVTPRDLLVLDSYDTDISKDFLEFLKLNCHIIVTCRPDFTKDLPQIDADVPVEHMEQNELVSIFQNDSGVLLDKQDIAVLDNFFKKGKDCVYLISLGAKLVYHRGYKIEKFAKMFEEGLASFEGNDKKIRDLKDNTYSKHTISSAMITLFGLQEFKTDEKLVLETIYFLEGINLKLEDISCFLSKYFDEDEEHFMEILLDLIDRGIIQYGTDKSLGMHDILKETIRYYLKPTLTDNKYVKCFIEKELLDILPKSFDVKIVIGKYKNHLKCVESIIDKTSEIKDYEIIIEYSFEFEKISYAIKRKLQKSEERYFVGEIHNLILHDILDYYLNNMEKMSASIREKAFILFTKNILISSDDIRSNVKNLQKDFLYVKNYIAASKNVVLMDMLDDMYSSNWIESAEPEFLGMIVDEKSKKSQAEKEIFVRRYAMNNLEYLHIHLMSLCEQLNETKGADKTNLAQIMLQDLTEFPIMSEYDILLGEKNNKLIRYICDCADAANIPLFPMEKNDNLRRLMDKTKAKIMLEPDIVVLNDISKADEPQPVCIPYAEKCSVNDASDTGYKIK